MDYRSVALREIGWGRAVVVLASMGALASIGLAACDDGGGGGGCPQLGGSWNFSGECLENASTTCTVMQNGCSVEISCTDGRALTGSVSSKSVAFSDDEVSCSGTLFGLEDEENDGVIFPLIEADCTPKSGGDSCEVSGECREGDCTMPEEEDGGIDEGSSGSGGSAGVFGGTSGEGGESGAAAGSGGMGGGAIDVDACASCVDTLCQSELSACTETNGCLPALTCTIGSACSQDDEACITAACQGAAMFTEDGVTAVNNVSRCMGENCLAPCTSSGPVAGAGGAGGGPAPQPCDTCEWALDNECDEIDLGGTGACPSGTDCSDCGSGSD